MAFTAHVTSLAGLLKVTAYKNKSPNECNNAVILYFHYNNCEQVITIEFKLKNK